MHPGLIVEALCKEYPTRTQPLRVLSDVSLRLTPGESAAIVGPSGCGKSTLLNILGALDTPSSGRVTLDGADPFQLDEPGLAEFRNRRIGFVFQDHHLLPQCSALENVLLPTLASRGATPGAIDRAKSLLSRVGLDDRLDHRPAELSGGQRQRVAVARALILRPVLILADEPTGNLDHASANEVCDLLVELHRDLGGILLVVTHSTALAARLSRQFALDDGRCRELGSGPRVGVA